MCMKTVAVGVVQVQCDLQADAKCLLNGDTHSIIAIHTWGRRRCQVRQSVGEASPCGQCSL